MLNIEIKAKSKNHNFVRNTLIEKGATFIGEDHQIDTYFNTSYGRLKLREGIIENNLIYYSREDIIGPKKSDIILYKSTPGSTLKKLLTKSNGILTVVDKIREIYFIENVKFHLDKVKNLGTFIEIEAIDAGGDIKKDKLLEQCKYYMETFKISESDLISDSYSDMVMRIEQKVRTAYDELKN